VLVVIGKTGQLARALANLPSLDGALFLGRDELDLTDTSALEAALYGIQPRTLINAAAYTAVDRAESEPEIAMAVNAEAPAAMARVCTDLGSTFVHVSTDYVFGGAGIGPFKESDPVAPESAYGRSKAAGEKGVQAAGGRYAILRTSWVYGATGANFVRTMLRLAATKTEIAVVADQLGAPTHADDLAQACAAIADGVSNGQVEAGLYHFCGGGGFTSWAGFAEEIFSLSREHGGPHAVVRHISTADYPTPAKRPSDSRLSTEKYDALRYEIRSWRAALADCVSKLAALGFA
jgi:dTDP-4-dehydrorhamnose reductase